MARVYDDPPPPGLHAKALEDLPPRSRAAYKAKQMAAAHNGTLTWDADGVSFTASGWKQNGSTFEVTVMASDADGPLPLDNPYRFTNPPLNVPHGTWRKETRIEAGPDGPQAVEYEIENVREDPLEAAKQIIESSVRYVAERKGWTPSRP